MASPVKQQAPEVLPPDFNQWDQDSAPETLPPDFFEKQGQTEATDPRNKLQKAFDQLTTVTPEQEQGHSWLTNKAQEFGAGAIGSLSPLVHPLNAAEGVVNAIAHPINTAKAIGSDAMEHPAQTLGGVVGGLATGGLAAEGGAPLLAKIPTRAKAGELFQSVMKDAADQPVSLTNSQEPLLRAMDLNERGNNAPRVVKQLLKRTTEPDAPPLTYKEARDFGSSLSRMSSHEAQRMTPAMKSQVSQLAKAFTGDTQAAADAVGRGDDFVKAMRDYSRASRNAEIAKKVAKWGGAATAGAVGLEGAHRLLKAFQ